MIHHESQDEGNGSWKERLLANEEGAWEAFLREFSGLMHHVALQIVHDYQEAEDVVQDVLMKLSQILDSFDSSRPFKQWLVAVVNNRAIDIRRSKERHGFQKRQLYDVHDSEFSMPPDRYSSARAVDHRDVWLAVTSLLELQNSKFATGLLLFADGYSYEEIPAMIECTPGRLKSGLHEVRTGLKKNLQIRGLTV